MSFVWIPQNAVLAIHRRQIAEHNGSDGVRDAGLLESALMRPKQLFAYGDPPDLAALAAAYAFGIARNHPFIDGNNRTALVTSRTFLVINGADIIARQEDKLATFLLLAAGELTEEALSISKTKLLNSL
jgi:death-on-curing protein